MLVYENYNKFIVATDTIKTMKDHVQSMEGEMESLEKGMERITAASNVLNESLSEKRQKIEKLSSVNRMLKRLQFLLELPARLSQCLEMKTYAVAVKYYLIANKILQQYNHLQSFENIQRESVEVMNRLKSTLRKIMMDPNADARYVEENTKLLLQLEEPSAEIRQTFLDVRREPLQQHIDSFQSDPSKSIREVSLPSFCLFSCDIAYTPFD